MKKPSLHVIQSPSLREVVSNVNSLDISKDEILQLTKLDDVYILLYFN